MARLTASLPLALLLAAGAPIMNAQTPSAEPFHGSLSELKGKAFLEGLTDGLAHCRVLVPDHEHGHFQSAF